MFFKRRKKNPEKPQASKPEEIHLKKESSKLDKVSAETLSKAIKTMLKDK